MQPYAYTESFHTTTTAYMPTDNLRVGFDDWTTNCGTPCYQNGITRSYLPGAPSYATATLIALVSPVASLIIFGAIAVFYAISSSFFGRAPS